MIMDLLLGAAALGSSDGRDFGAVDEGFGTGRGLRVSVLFRWLPFHSVYCVL